LYVFAYYFLLYFSALEILLSLAALIPTSLARNFLRVATLELLT
jgi:hypothetical protein